MEDCLKWYLFALLQSYILTEIPLFLPALLVDGFLVDCVAYAGYSNAGLVMNEISVFWRTSPVASDSLPGTAGRSTGLWLWFLFCLDWTISTVCWPLRPLDLVLIWIDSDSLSSASLRACHRWARQCFRNIIIYLLCCSFSRRFAV